MVARDGSGPRHRPATAELLRCFGVDPLCLYGPSGQSGGTRERSRQVDQV